MLRALIQVSFDTDEHPKPNTTPEQMAKLPTTFKKEGVVTPASASGICDGAGALVLASESAVKKPEAHTLPYSEKGAELPYMTWSRISTS